MSYGRITELVSYGSRDGLRADNGTAHERVMEWTKDGARDGFHTRYGRDTNVLRTGCGRVTERAIAQKDRPALRNIIV